jgi:3-aminobutyryl-CoA ammonia-lyase
MLNPTGFKEPEQMILVDGNESLCLGYTDVRAHENVYVGDMMEYKATLTHVGNTSRDCRIEVLKLATPAARAGRKNCRPGDMVWFREPVLCTEGNVRLVVKRELQRGRQPDGIVEKVRLHDPCRAGDYMEFYAGIHKIEGTRITI